MPVTQSILNMALAAADGRRVTGVFLRVGRMSAIVPSSVEVFFEHLSKGTQAEGAQLHFEIAPLAMACGECGRPADLTQWSNERPQVAMARALAQGCPCGSKRLQVRSGLDFAMVKIEVEED